MDNEMDKSEKSCVFSMGLHLRMFLRRGKARTSHFASQQSWKIERV